MGSFNTGSQSGTGSQIGINASQGVGGSEQSSFSTSSPVFEPTAQALNRLLQGQLEGMFASTLPEQGPRPVAPTKPAKGAPAADIAAYKEAKKEYDTERRAWETDNRQRTAYSRTISQRGGLTPFMKPMFDLATPQAEELAYLNRIRSLADEPRVSALEQRGLDTMYANADPTERVAAAQRMLEQVTGPTLRNTLTASGMGRSGAQAEALSRAGTELSLPILTQVAAARDAAGRAAIGLGGSSEQRYGGRLLAAADAARIPREARLQETLRPAQWIMQMMRGLPAGVSVGQNSMSQSSGSSFSEQLSTGLNLGANQSSGSQTGVQVGKG